MVAGPGARIGPYEIVSLLGEGGMGKVWRARHSGLKRDDALKVLPDDLALDPDRLARFQREAQILASLNHPNIAHVYGLEQAEDVHALVMELVEGATLADRLVDGPLPTDEALPVARQLADALETAHEQGVVHRDLKPANIKLRPDGTVKVLDFGLAKLASVDDSARPDPARRLSNSPTITSPALMTRVGVILGTAAYMSPEQARGRAVDRRADVWAFGCVLFEMLSGRRPFDGDDVTETVASVVKSDPPWDALPATIPSSIRRLLRRCLQKDPSRRLRDIADAKLEIDEAETELDHPATIAAMPSTPRNRERVAWISALVVVLAALAVMTALSLRGRSVEPQEVRLQIVTPSGRPNDFAISPDGRNVVFAALADGRGELWIRPLGAVAAQRLPGTLGAEYPFWSPDGRSIGFFADQKLKRMEIASGTVQTLADAPAGRGGAWGDGVIVFAPANISPLLRIPARGGTVESATRLESPAQASHRLPVFLPDGRHFLFFVTGTPAVEGAYAGSLDSPETRRLFASESAAVFAAPDVVLFRRENALMGQRVDTGTLDATGDPFTVGESVAAEGGIVGRLAASASAAGSFVYRSAGTAQRRLVWFDRSGKQLDSVGEPDEFLSGGDIQWQLSPDGRAVVANRNVNNNADLWIIDLARGVPRRFTSDASSETYPVWSPDSSRLAFGSARLHGSVVHDVFVKSVGGAGDEMPVLQSGENKTPWDWSRDGRFILFTTLSAKTGPDLWIFPTEGTQKPFAFVQTPGNETGGAFSPDGKWIAYFSNETGRNEIYVQPFPGPARSTLVSAGGGVAPLWSEDGREIFYRAQDGRVMTIPLSFTRDAVTPGTPEALFTLPPGATFKVDRRTQRFLVNTSVGGESIPPITVVLNWKPPIH
jgi:eukaryotic-like serine/threonine-protein kinase